MHSFADLQFSEMMGKSKSVKYLLHHQTHMPKTFSIIYSVFIKFITHGASKFNETNFQ